MAEGPPFTGETPMRIRLLFALTALLVTCAERPVLAQHATDEEAEVHAVWLTALRHQFDDTVMVVEEAPFPSWASPDMIEARCLGRESCRQPLEEFVVVAKVRSVRPERLAPLRVTLFTREERSRVEGFLTREQRMARFGPEGALFSVTDVAFDASRTRAVVSVFRSCGVRCGSGGLLLLERTGSGWTVLRELASTRS